MTNKNILKWALVIGIIIVLNLFFHFATRLFYQEPQWEDFCQTKQVTITPTNQADCVAQGGAWTENAAYESSLIEALDGEGPKVMTKSFCDLNYTCQKNYEVAREFYQRNIFVVLVVLGLAVLIIGFLAATNEVISLSLSYGGVLSFVVASVQYWSAMEDYLRVIILGLALAILIYLGHKKFKSGTLN
ncbi:MAG: hypothetical protein WCX70_02285 [Candidatus Paceibacterota bacterium]